MTGDQRVRPTVVFRTGLAPLKIKKNYESLPFTDPAQGSVYSCSVLF